MQTLVFQTFFINVLIRIAFKSCSFPTGVKDACSTKNSMPYMSSKVISLFLSSLHTGIEVDQNLNAQHYNAILLSSCSECVQHLRKSSVKVLRKFLLHN